MEGSTRPTARVTGGPWGGLIIFAVHTMREPGARRSSPARRRQARSADHLHEGFAGSSSGRELAAFFFTRILGQFLIWRKKAEISLKILNFSSLFFWNSLLCGKIYFLDGFVMGRFLIEVHEKRCVGPVQSEQRGGQTDRQTGFQFCSFRDSR